MKTPWRRGTWRSATTRAKPRKKRRRIWTKSTPRLSGIRKAVLAILRLALCEMKYCDDVPVSVAINEAVELAKKYATLEDAQFVNGLLGSAARAAAAEGAQ